MARITIIEQDLTGLSAQLETSNTVYVPGYASRGPVNKKTLLTSVAQMNELFGSKPFTFADGELEKSWIYANELLRAGLPVLYERVYNKTGDTKAFHTIRATSGSETMDFKVRARYEGTYGKDFKISIDSTGNDTEGNPTYKIVINNQVYMDTTFNKLSNNYIGKALEVNKEVILEEGTIPSAWNWATVTVNSIPGTLFTLTESNADMSKIDVINLMNSTDNIFHELADKALYEIKFITSGGYPNIGTITDGSNTIELNIGLKIRDAASLRGDALGMIDTKQGLTKTLYKTTVEDSLVTSLIGDIDKNSYLTIVAPYVKLNITGTDTQEWMPGSFAYLKSLANSVIANPIWFAVAGAVRGRVSDVVDIEFEIDSETLRTWQFTSQCINPIRDTKAYGYLIDGNRTLNNNLDKDNVKSLAFTNIRILANEIKKQVDLAAAALAYESNDIILWKNFQSRIESKLNEMQTGRGIDGYKLTRLESPKRGLVRGSIQVLPNEAVESFEILFSLEDQLN